MTEKKAKSRIPSVRALDALYTRRERQIDKKTDAHKMEELQRTISDAGKHHAKHLLEILRSSIPKNSPFKEIKNSCNTWNGTNIDTTTGKITLVLQFDPEKDPISNKASLQIEDVNKRRNEERKRLSDWYDQSLIKIINRENTITDFIVEE
jgi:acetolactate synthase small subunit